MHKKSYALVGLGGTFDHFHAGHKAFIDFAARLGKKLSIGVTAPEMVLAKHYAESIEPLRARKQAVKQYCKTKNYHAEVFTLYDLYGTTLDEKSGIEALAVTPETEQGALTINRTRAKLGLSELPVFSCPLVYDQEGKNHIHSVRIRAGEITRRGEVYRSLLDKKITLTQKQRAYFSTAQGPLVDAPSESLNELKVVVGDVTLERFNSQKWQYAIAIFDTKTSRENIAQTKLALQPKSKKHLETFTANNPAGAITPELTTLLLECIKKGEGYIQVDGEEDLATVASVLLLPLNARVYYGQPQKGLVELLVTESLKLKFYTALSPDVNHSPETTSRSH